MSRSSIFRCTALFALLVTLAACKQAPVIIVMQPPEPLPPDATVVFVDDPSTVAEIDAVRNLAYENHRADHLVRIARRQNIGPDSQIHLIDTAFDVLRFEESRVRVILQLIDNQVFCVDAKAEILKRLDLLNFDMHRNAVLSALDNRGQPVVFPAPTAAAY